MIPSLARPGDATPRRRGRSRSLARRTADSIGGAIAEVLENEAVASSPGAMQALDPRMKLLSVVLFAVAASLVHSITMLLAFIVATMCMAAASRISAASFARKVLGSAGLFALLLAAPSATTWITPGPVLVPFGPLTITVPGLLIATRLVARVVAGAGFGLLVVWTTRWTDLLRALGALGVPDLVVATLAMTQKQIMSLLRTVESMHLARESRMLSSRSARENRQWVVERMAFVARRSLKTADEVYDAMLARGFTGAMPSLVELRTRPSDWIWLTASVATCVLIVRVDRMVFPL